MKDQLFKSITNSKQTTRLKYGTGCDTSSPLKPDIIDEIGFAHKRSSGHLLSDTLNTNIYTVGVIQYRHQGSGYLRFSTATSGIYSSHWSRCISRQNTGTINTE